MRDPLGAAPLPDQQQTLLQIGGETVVGATYHMTDLIAPPCGRLFAAPRLTTSADALDLLSTPCRLDRATGLR